MTATRALTTDELERLVLGPERDRWAPPEADGPEPAVPTIYFARAETGLIKIGWTARGVRRRLAQLRTGSGPLELVATAPGSQRDERAVHKRLVLDRVPGTEWFRIDAALAVEVAAGLGGCVPKRPLPAAETERQRWEGERAALLAALADAEARASASVTRTQDLARANPGAVAEALLQAAAESKNPLTAAVLFEAADAARLALESDRAHARAHDLWRHRGRR